MDLNHTSKRAIEIIGSAVAEHRPDLNGNLTDEFIVEAGLYALIALFYTDYERGQIVLESFNSALYGQNRPTLK